MKFHKYQALGNDYIVLEEAGDVEIPVPLVQRICDRHFGLGSDGILVGKFLSGERRFALRIFNPDGSEAEKSGNGIRIFAKYLWDSKSVGTDPFSLLTKGGVVQCQVRDLGRQIYVEMGKASFDSEAIPMLGPKREVVGESIKVGDVALKITGVSVGNPHCVVHIDEPTPEIAKRLGPLLENHKLFPNRTNVQFVKVIGPHRIRIEIWERGAGYTLASGSSSCAAAAASVRLGLCKEHITVDMPGGSLEIEVRPDFSMTMIGPARKVADGVLSDELMEDAG